METHPYFRSLHRGRVVVVGVTHSSSFHSMADACLLCCAHVVMAANMLGKTAKPKTHSSGSGGGGSSGANDGTLVCWRLITRAQPRESCLHHCRRRRCAAVVVVAVFVVLLFVLIVFAFCLAVNRATEVVQRLQSYVHPSRTEP